MARCSARRIRVCSATSCAASSITRAHGVEVGGGGTGKGEVDDGAGPTAREVADQADVTVGDDVDGAVDTAEAGQAHRHVLDDTGDAADGHRVADVVLVLHRHEDAREVVAHDLLRAEARAWRR